MEHSCLYDCNWMGKRHKDELSFPACSGPVADRQLSARRSAKSRLSALGPISVMTPKRIRRSPQRQLSGDRHRSRNDRNWVESDYYIRVAAQLMSAGYRHQFIVQFCLSFYRYMPTFISGRFTEFSTFQYSIVTFTICITKIITPILGLEWRCTQSNISCSSQVA